MFCRPFHHNTALVQYKTEDNHKLNTTQIREASDCLTSHRQCWGGRQIQNTSHVCCRLRPPKLKEVRPCQEQHGSGKEGGHLCQQTISAYSSKSLWAERASSQEVPSTFWRSDKPHSLVASITVRSSVLSSERWSGDLRVSTSRSITSPQLPPHHSSLCSIRQGINSEPLQTDFPEAHQMLWAVTVKPSGSDQPARTHCPHSE